VSLHKYPPFFWYFQISTQPCWYAADSVALYGGIPDFILKITLHNAVRRSSFAQIWEQVDTNSLCSSVFSCILPQFFCIGFIHILVKIAILIKNLKIPDFGQCFWEP